MRVRHVGPTANLVYQHSLPRPEHRELGETVSEAWEKLLRATDRFASVDSARFEDPAITSREYAMRYGTDAVRNRADLLRVFGIDHGEDLGVPSTRTQRSMGPSCSQKPAWS